MGLAKKILDKLYQVAVDQRFISTLKLTPEFVIDYQEEYRRFLLKRMKAFIIAGNPCYVGFGVLDYILFREHFVYFISLRLSLTAFSVLVFFFASTKRGFKYTEALSLILNIYLVLTIVLMTVALDGFANIYFSGILLLMSVAGLFFTWRPRTTMLYGFCTVGLYTALNSWAHGFDPMLAATPIFILAGGWTMNSLGSVTSENMRLEDFLKRRQIESAHQRLKELDESKTRFFANISHELRTPLTMIIGPLEMALGRKEAPSSEFLQAMLANGRRLLRQVNALLDMSKLDVGKMQCQYEHGSVSEILQELYSAALPRSKENQVQLTLSGHESLPESVFDYEKVETAAANLISNAMKFTPNGGSIEIRAWTDAKSQTLFFSVKDSGHGIPKEKQHLLFERFQQIDDSQSRAHKGTGLGLAVSKKFIELHGGTITLESESGKGACFTVVLPMFPANTQTVTPAAKVILPTVAQTLVPEVNKEVMPTADLNQATNARAAGRMVSLADLSGREGAENGLLTLDKYNDKRYEERNRHQSVILFADDNEDLRFFVKAILEKEFTVLLAENGRRCLEEARKFKPDLILTDMMMPEMTGTEVCREVKRDASLNATPVILLTANVSTESRIANLNEGADDYLGKPFADQELLARIRNLLTLRKQQAQIKKQLLAAQEIQRALLPPLKAQIANITFEALYRPCDELSGDFFDCIPSGDWLYVYVADITSHGVASAQVTYLIKEMFRQKVGASPAVDIKTLYEEVRQDYTQHKLPYDVGLLLMKINQKTHEIEFASTGFPAPVFFGLEESPTIIDIESSPLISTLHSEHDKGQVLVLKKQAKPGSWLYMWTDGASEFHRPDNKMYGDRRLMKTLNETHQGSWPEDLMSKLSSEVSSKGFPDDITIVRIGFDVANLTKKAA